MKKRGQFYLIAAFVIISVIVGLTTISNNSRTEKDSELIYELSEGLDIESEYVLDYGIANNLDNTELMETFASTFSDSSKDFEFYFIFGEEDNLKAYKYFNGIKDAQDYSVQDGNILTTINGVEYSFELTQGENFYYIIFKENEGEKYVATN